MNSYFAHPSNGYVEKATGAFTWLWALIFGPFYFAYRGACRGCDLEEHIDGRRGWLRVHLRDVRVVQASPSR